MQQRTLALRHRSAFDCCVFIVDSGAVRIICGMQRSHLLCSARILPACFALGVAVVTVLASPAIYNPVKSVSIPGEGLWDYVKVDADARRVYVAHANQINVLDGDSGALVGTIPDVKEAHGIEVVPSLGKGFFTNGLSASVSVFDLKWLKKTEDIPAGKKADAVIYDPASRRIFAFNGDDESVTVIDPAKESVVTTLKLGGGPEFPIVDGEGHLFVNLEDKNTVLRLDTKSLQVLNRWRLEPCDEPASMAIARAHARLFVGCGNKMMAAMDAKTGRVLAHLPIGEHVDATAFDPQTGLVFSSTYDGAVTVIKENDPDHFSLMQSIKTKQGSKTMGLDVKTHRIYVPSGSFRPTLTAGAIKTPPGTKLAPGSFELLIFGVE